MGTVFFSFVFNDVCALFALLKWDEQTLSNKSFTAAHRRRVEKLRGRLSQNNTHQADLNTVKVRQLLSYFASGKVFFNFIFKNIWQFSLKDYYQPSLKLPLKIKHTQTLQIKKLSHIQNAHKCSQKYTYLLQLVYSSWTPPHHHHHHHIQVCLISRWQCMSGWILATFLGEKNAEMLYMLRNHPKTKVKNKLKPRRSLCFTASIHLWQKLGCLLKILMILKVIWGEQAGIGIKR